MAWTNQVLKSAPCRRCSIKSGWGAESVDYGMTGGPCGGPCGSWIFRYFKHVPWRGKIIGSQQSWGAIWSWHCSTMPHSDSMPQEIGGFGKTSEISVPGARPWLWPTIRCHLILSVPDLGSGGEVSFLQYFNLHRKSERLRQIAMSPRFSFWATRLLGVPSVRLLLSSATACFIFL